MYHMAIGLEYTLLPRAPKMKEKFIAQASPSFGLADLRHFCYRLGHAGGAFAARSGPGEAWVGAGWASDGPLPNVRARLGDRRRGDRRARPAQRVGARRHAYSLHGLAGCTARQPRRAGRRGETDLSRRASGL